MSVDNIPSWIMAFVQLATLYLLWRTKLGVDVVHKATNSMKDELVAEVRKSSKAEGVKEEKERSEPATDNIVITR